MSTATAPIRGYVSSARRPAFYLLTLALALFFVNAMRDPLSFGVLTFTPGHEFPTHRVHHVALGSVFWLFLLGLLAQFYRPEDRIGWLQGAILVFSILAVVAAIVSGVGEGAGLLIFIVPAIVIGLLHPARDDLVPSIENRDVRLLGLALVAAIPLTIFAAGQIDLQQTMTDDHAFFTHYAMMATAALFVGLAAIIGSLKSAGWRVLVYAAGVIVVLVGAMAIAFPGAEQGVNVGTPAAAVAVLWGLAFVGLAEYTERVDRTEA